MKLKCWSKCSKHKGLLPGSAMMMTIIRSLIVFWLCLGLISCETVSYYGQAIKGQLFILSHRESINKLIEADSTDETLRNKLETILEIREFAELELGLPVENNYSTFVNLERPYVVWNVFASPEFSTSPVTWCYPIAGCVGYRGYFSEQAAVAYAEKLREEKQLDVYVGGVAAYSTLGWFSDSILNTVIRREDFQLAELIFHELAHQLIYIPGDTVFNESFATALEIEGMRRWLTFVDGNESADLMMADANINRERQDQFVGLISKTIEDLQGLYKQDLELKRMRLSKQSAIDDLRLSYLELKANWGGYGGYDAWFARDLNNAQLSTVDTYFNWVPAFQTLLKEESYNLNAFYARVRELEELSVADRRSFLDSKAD